MTWCNDIENHIESYSRSYSLTKWISAQIRISIVLGWMNSKHPFYSILIPMTLQAKIFILFVGGTQGVPDPKIQPPTSAPVLANQRERWEPGGGVRHEGGEAQVEAGQLQENRRGVAWRPRSSTPRRCTRSRSSTRPVDMRSPCVEQWMHMVTSSLQVWLNNGAKQAGNWGTFANWKPPVSISEGSSVSSGPGGWGRGERDQRGAAAGSSSSSAQRWF